MLSTRETLLARTEVICLYIFRPPTYVSIDGGCYLIAGLLSRGVTYTGHLNGFQCLEFWLPSVSANICNGDLLILSRKLEVSTGRRL
jgi:hypothetical protein